MKNPKLIKDMTAQLNDNLCYTPQPAYKFYAMEHCGGLVEAVDTIERITEREFKELLPLYDYYCYDERIECLRWLIRDLASNYTIHGKIHSPWLLISSNSIATIKELARRKGN